MMQERWCSIYIHSLTYLLNMMQERWCQIYIHSLTYLLNMIEILYGWIESYRTILKLPCQINNEHCTPTFPEQFHVISTKKILLENRLLQNMKRIVSCLLKLKLSHIPQFVGQCADSTHIYSKIEEFWSNFHGSFIKIFHTNLVRAK